MGLEVLVVVLAGGEGTRLKPLTEKRTKPAVPIGGKYRLIDIPLSNAYNSRLRRIIVLTQGKDHSLQKHIKDTWPSDPKSQSFVDVTSPQGTNLSYAGDADAVRHVQERIQGYNPNIVLVVPGDHLLKMQYYTFVKYLVDRGADATISVIPRTMEYAKSFGSLDISPEGRIRHLREKDPNTPFRTPDGTKFYASMGIYAFKTEALFKLLAGQGNLFAGDLFPKMLTELEVLAYNYPENNHIEECLRVEVEGNGLLETRVGVSPDSDYWRDVGSIREYFDANMDLVDVNPSLNLFAKRWPFYTYSSNLGPAKVVSPRGNRGALKPVLLSEGSILSDVEGSNVVASPNVYVDDSCLEGVIIFEGSNIQHCTLRRVIVDKNVFLANATIGLDPEEDQKRGIFVDPSSGIRVVRKGYDSRKPDTWAPQP